MPIQFQCPHCQHAMQLPDTAAGKQGKCPKCSNAVTVPAAAATAPSNPHDEEFWSELNEKKEAAPQEEKDPHKTEKRTDAQILKKMLGKAEEAKVVKRIGVPWERPREGGMFDRYWDTAIGVMNHSTDTFAVMKIQGGIRGPFGFLLIGTIAGSLILSGLVTLWNVNTLVSALQAPAPAAESKTGEAATEPAPPVTRSITPQDVIPVVLACLGTLTAGIIVGLVHVLLQTLCLKVGLAIAGVKDSGFERNFRIAAFTNGSVFLANVVPVLGVAFMLFLWFNGMVKGIISVYEIPQNKAAIAVIVVFVPLVMPIAAGVLFQVFRLLGYI